MNEILRAAEGTSEVEAFDNKIQPEKLESLQESVTNVETRNESLEGERHPITGVPFERKEVELPSGETITGVFPEFDTLFEAQLDETQYLESDARQFKECNSQLKEAIEQDPQLKNTFSAEQLQDIEAGCVPEGYVWHHHEEPGTMQLIDKPTHDLTGHTGGRFLWGGGSDFR